MKSIVLCCVTLTLWTSSALAQSASPAAATQTPSPSPAASGIDIGGLVDVYYDYYSTKPAGDAQFRNFDTKHNQFAMSMAEVWLAKTPTADSRVGFKFKLNFGPASSNFIHATEPGGTPYQNIQEAYVSYLAPAGKGLQIDAGVFATPHGIEVIEAKDDMNYSRGLLFSLAIPYYHSGVRFTYAPTDKVSLMGAVVNGWNNIVDNNTGKTLHGSVTIKPIAALSITENWMGGPEQPDNNDNFRHLSDTLATYTYNPKLSLAAEYDYGHEKLPTGSVHWSGFAGFAKYQATPTVAVSPRFEFYDDADGYTTGTAQKLKEVTGTVELKAADNLLWRIEYRCDWSNQKPFLKSDGSFQDTQQSIAFGALFSFSGKVQ
jgi:hypothetical protein